MRGHTLVELAAVLALGALVTASLAPAGRRYVDRAAVLQAREEVVGLLARARIEAMSAGDSRVVIEGSPWAASLVVADSIVERRPLEAAHGVSVETGGGRTRVELGFNALGLGEVASETLTFRRGSASATLVVAGYGRVRRR